MKEENARAYWAANLRLIFTYVAIWFVVSYGCGILLVDELNQIQFFGFKLGFGLRNRERSTCSWC